MAAFVVSAVAALPAMANEEKKLEAAAIPALKNCPVDNPETRLCFAGITAGGSRGGFFQLGGVRVPLNKSITIQGGLSPKQLFVIAPDNGTETLEAPELKVPTGIKLITPQIQELAEWPAELKAAFKEAVKNKEAGLTVKIEVAGTELYSIEHAVDELNLAFEQGDAFILPLKVSLHNTFLEKLGGGPCEIGSDEHPIFQHLTSDPHQSGSGGTLHFIHEETVLALTGTRLTDLSWEVPVGGEAHGCGGAYESYVDRAINQLLLSYPEQPGSWQHGVTILQGNLYQATKSVVEKF